VRLLSRFSRALGVLGVLDGVFLRTPFEQGQAERYARQRPAFGDLDERLADGLAPVLARARTVLDLGSGAGELARCLAARHPSLHVVTVDASHAFSPRLRARAEALPLAAASVDVAICLSSLRHARDRKVALRELRRVVVAGGTALVVEMDPDADAARRERHLAAMPTFVSRASFRLGLAIAPPIADLAATARDAGWSSARIEPDPLQPLALLWLS
jgi:ubiquinone/menaquinone biosynthesis C-methylase UbiE